MTTPAERRTFAFQPTIRERPPSRSTHTSEEYIHVDLNGDAPRNEYLPPFSSATPSTPGKAYLKNYVFPPTTSETANGLDYQTYDTEHPTDDIDDPMGKGRRPRGESDLGRPSLRSRAPSVTYGLTAIPSEYEPDTPLHHKAAFTFENKYSLPEELITSILIPLPYLLGSLVHLLTSAINHRQHSHRVEVAEEILEELASTALPVTTKNSGLFTACALASGTLVVIGLYGRLTQRHQLDRRRSNSSASKESSSPVQEMFTWKYLKRIFSRTAAIGLPFLAMVEIGGIRTGLFLLAGAAEGLIAPDSRVEQVKLKSWRRLLQSHRYLSGLFVLSLLADLFYLKTTDEPSSTIRGYLALVKPILLLQSPMPPTPAPSPSPTKPISPLINTRSESTTTLIAGVALASLTLTVASILSHIPAFDVRAAVLFGSSVLASAALLAFSRPAALRTVRKLGFALGLLVCGTFGIATDSESGSFLATVATTALSAALYFAVQIDTHAMLPFGITTNTHTKSHSYGQHASSQSHVEVHGSKFTQVLLHHTREWPLLHSILSEKESRRITYFMVINLTFMFIQTFYSIVSGSLGLLSDSIHMLFDCVGLFAGLVAAVMSKWPPNLKFPYGYGKVEVLSGLGNGIFLMIISVEIIWESMERVAEGAELKRMNELLLVSVAGLLINLLGLQLTGHHHHHGGGGDCGHSHSHTHSHEKEPSTTNGLMDGSALNGTSLAGAENIEHSAHGAGHAGHHHHSHANENMAGIYLHILADTMGSVAVIVSTLLTQYTGWYGWDPLASFVIAVLIIAASIPLVVGSAKQLLLTMPSEMEYTLRTTLQGTSELRGVSGYAVPRFWLDERHVTKDHTHAHDHDSPEPHVNGMHVHHEQDSHANYSHESHEHQNGAPKQSHSRSKSDPHAHSHAHSSLQLHVHEEEHAEHSHDHGRHKSIYHTPSSSVDLKHDHSYATHDHDTHSPHKHSTSNHTHSHSEHLQSSGPKLLGVIHVVAQPRADLEDVRQRVDAFLRDRGMDVLVHVEREGQSRCWCGGTTRSGHGRARSTVAMELYGQ